MQALLDLLGRGLQNAQLEFVAPEGKRWRLGHGEPKASVLLQDGDALRWMLRNPGLRFGEAYVDGRWEPADDDLLHVVGTGLRITNQWESRALSRRLKGLQSRLHEFNDARSAQRNIHHHYDLQPDFYASFLDEDLHYSCAYFAKDSFTLEQAQQAKCEIIARKLRLQPGARVLDIGCGFGSMALYLAEHHGAQVTGITLAEEQLRVARRRATERGLEGQVEFRLEDYRKTLGSFDAIVSVGMFEHVGRPNYATYFRRIHELLRPGGHALVHTIGRTTPPGGTNRWIQKYIFPGGAIPAASEMIAMIEPTGLVLTDFEVWRQHYAKTLAVWHSRFQREQRRWSEHFGEAFCRMWRFYLQASEASFRWGDLVVFHAQLAKPPIDLPLTRDYLWRAPPRRHKPS